MSAIWLTCTFFGGCILDDPTASAVVVMDRDAVRSGALVEQHGMARSASALPLLIDADMPVEVRNGRAAQRFVVRHGEFVHVQGASLVVARHTLGVDVPGDRLVLYSARETAEEVAALTSGKALERAPGMFELRVANAFAHLAQLEPEGIREVRPIGYARGAVEDLDRVPPDLDFLDLDRRTLGTAPNAAQALTAELDPVGLYLCEDDGLLTLDASDRFTGCGAEFAGEIGSYRLEGRMVVLESLGGRQVFELGADGALSGAAGIRCTLLHGGT